MTASSTISWRGDAPCTVDVGAFLAAAQDARGPDDLARAIALYRGDLLPECDDEEIEGERTRLRQLFREVLERAIAEREALKDFTAARTYAQRLLAHDAPYEPAYRYLIRLHALNGDRAAAVQIYNTCVHVLHDELDARPSPVTVALIQQVLDSQFDLPAPLSAERRPTVAPVGLPQSWLPSPLVPAGPGRSGAAAIWTLLGWTHLYRALFPRASRLLRPHLARLLPRSASPVPPAGAYTVTMAAEAEEAAPGAFIVVRGASNGVPRQTPLWTVVHTNGYFWPQTQVLRVGVRWNGFARIGDTAADRGKRLDVLAVLVDRQTDDEFRQWLRNGDRNGRYPAVTALPAGAHIAARVAVTVM